MYIFCVYKDFNISIMLNHRDTLIVNTPAVQNKKKNGFLLQLRKSPITRNIWGCLAIWYFSWCSLRCTFISVYYPQVVFDDIWPLIARQCCRLWTWTTLRKPGWIKRKRSCIIHRAESLLPFVSTFLLPLINSLSPLLSFPLLPLWR